MIGSANLRVFLGTRLTDTQYSYTAQGQLQTVSVIRQDEATVSGSPTTTYHYDNDGNVTRISYPNGTGTDYDYSQMWNASGGIDTVSNWRGGTSGTLLSSFVYTFNTQRQKAESVETVLNVEGTGTSTYTTTLFTWTYDNDGRLTDETSNDGVTADNYHNHYDYDGAGNRVDEKMAPGYDNSDPYNFSNQYTLENFYTYNADGQLQTEADNQPTGQNFATTYLQYIYDANGSLKETDTVTTSGSTITTTPVTTYGYDARNRMTSMTNVSSGVTTTYAYNDGGDRVGQTTGSAVTTYVVDDNNPTGYSQVLETWTNASTTTPATTYVVGATIISQTVSGTQAGTTAGTQYIMPDGHGSTRQLTSYTSDNTNGRVVARYDYDGFGNSITVFSVTANVVSTLILYTGQMWNASLGEYDLRAREYLPSVGRFTSFDPADISASEVGDLNKYLYANANPVNGSDPSGHFDLVGMLVTAGIQGLIGGIVAGGIDYAIFHNAKHALKQAALWGSVSFLAAGSIYGAAWWLAGDAAVAAVEAAAGAGQLAANGLRTAAVEYAGMEAAETAIAGGNTAARLSKEPMQSRR